MLRRASEHQPAGDEFARRLKQNRIAAGLSQEALAERASVSVQAVSALERGFRRAPYPTTVVLLADALDLSGDERQRFEESARRSRRKPRAASASDSEYATNLPAPVSPLVGRTVEIAEIAALLESRRLVTLAGPGGVGKTRVALETGAALLERFPGGVWLIELARIEAPELVAATVARVFEIGNAGRDGNVDAAIVAALKHKRALLLFDNCEHVVDGVAVLAEQILRHCPDVRILATSRERLRIDGEELCRVPSLQVPVTGAGVNAEEARRYDAIALFVQRARSIAPAFTLTDENAPVVADICRRLDGIPLAIELAAPHLKLLGVDELARRIGARLELLTGGSRAAPPRQQTLRALMDWSYLLLAPHERALFRRLAVFQGTWTIAAVDEVCGATDETPDTFGGLSALVDKSLVSVEADGEDRRFRLLESTREYAAMRFAETGEREAVERRYVTYYHCLATHLDETRFETNLDPWLQRVAVDIDNYRRTLHFTLAEKRDPERGAAIATALAPFWRDGLDVMEGRSWIERALALVEEHSSPHLRARLLLGLAQLDSDSATGLEPAGVAATMFEQCGDRRNVALALHTRAEILTRIGRDAEAMTLLERTMDVARALRLPRLIATVAASAAICAARTEPNMQTARRYHEESIALKRALGETRRLISSLANLAEYRFAAGELDAAVATIREALALSQQHGSERRVLECSIILTAYLLEQNELPAAARYARDGMTLAVRRAQHWWAAVAMEHLAQIAARTGDVVRAATLVGYVDAVYAAEAISREFSERVGYERIVSLLEAALEPDRIQALLQAGSRLDEPAALALALGVQAEPVPAP